MLASVNFGSTVASPFPSMHTRFSMACSHPAWTLSTKPVLALHAAIYQSWPLSRVSVTCAELRNKQQLALCSPPSRERSGCSVPPAHASLGPCSACLEGTQRSQRSAAHPTLLKSEQLNSLFLPEVMVIFCFPLIRMYIW